MMCVVLGPFRHKCDEVKVTLQTAHDQGARQKIKEKKRKEKSYLMLPLLIGNVRAFPMVGVLQQWGD